MLKKLLLITLAMLLIFGACACSNGSQKATEKNFGSFFIFGQVLLPES